jgi:hypothetical protein
LGHHLLSHCQKSAPRGGGGRTCLKGGATPQVDGDAIGFDASDCPKSIAGDEQVLLLISPTIVNVKLYHVLINGGATLYLISLEAFKKLQIPLSKL